MAIFKCKMCGGMVEFSPGATVGECDSCGTKQTLPRLDDERRVNLYDRANHFRRANEYDKAMGIYETILAEDKTDAEAYWSIVLCRYGVEYVEDPASHKRVPTVNRAQYTSVLADEDYKSALQYADTLQKSIYEAEAKAIDEIQKGILEISQKEEPFDVFICYKETDANGRRTPDSVLATELYHELTKAGYKVFFSRITLEDKLGTAYEPYIFAALHSAKVMVVLGTKAEHFNAVWVKNEWSRYLALIQNGEKKTLIPAYKDMDPYDLPEAFSHLQAQDMAKLGFMQDLIRGIRKITGEEEPKPIKETPVAQSTAPQNANVVALKKRGFMALEDGEWERADGFFEEALNQDAEDAECYLGKLMAELKIRKREDLKNAAEPFDDRNNCKKASRFDAAIAKELADANAYIRERNEIARKEKIYQDAIQESKHGTEEKLNRAESLFRSIPGYKDADLMANQCREKAATVHKEQVYQDASVLFDSENYYSAAELFDTILDYRDARDRAVECRKKIEELKVKRKQEESEKAEAARIAEEKRKKLIKKVAIIGMPSVAAVIVFLIVLNSVIIPASKYKKAVALSEAGEYARAVAAFKAIDNYKDVSEKIEEIKPAYYKELLSKANVGSIVFYGAYEQDNDTTNGKDDIEWLVLDKQDDKALVISKYALDCQPYNTEYEDVTWETCTLRKWLNGTFIKDAFNETEQGMILTATVTADKNPEYSTNPGKDTKDKVFLLSITEANKYFASDSARQCAPTAYAIAQGAWKSDSYTTSEGKAACWWWLRSPGFLRDWADGVDNVGSVSEDGFSVNYDDNAVRPAMWIKTN